MSKDSAPAEIPHPGFLKIDVRSVIGFATSGFFLWLLITQSSLEWRQIQKAINNIHTLLWLFAACVLLLLFIYIQSLRTRIIFVDRHTSMRQTSAYPSLIIGYFYNSLLPGNLGEVVRMWHFSRANKKSFSSATAVVILEKVLDANLLIPIILFTFFSIPFNGNFLAKGLLLMLVGIAIANDGLVVINSNK